MYRDLAPWFHLLTAPEDYADEAAAALALLRAKVDGPLGTLLELGSGGGNMASHLKREVRLTLTDLSGDMLDVSRTINPDCEHIVGDMRTLRLGRTFDAVLAHDAIVYMTTEADLRAAMTTAFEHLRPGGAALFEPDYVIVRRHTDGHVEVSHDHHVEGLFPRQRWLDLMAEVGFAEASSQVDDEDRVVFAGRRPL